MASLALRSAKILYTKTLRNFDSIFKFKFKLFPDFSECAELVVCDDSLIDETFKSGEIKMKKYTCVHA